ncbi:hypothetical protein Q31b_46540 [Novipirellula aureliae]|uniref:Sialate O-acetylesterase domain-containing protein n=1 Tax=Novipirellula aureliae TaxID=2527966 RepID=A0A5C6DNT3_9BACT|nr:sialate O-acetylesterase [Novipirellula aureliae]TWU37865.1 hypothetical protein Q31b_46540 [Novipirellula aureliae]
MTIIRPLCIVALFLTCFAPLTYGQRQATVEEQRQQGLLQKQSDDKTPALRLAGVFGSKMVLQQQTDAPIWGMAKPGEPVWVSGSWNQAISKTTANASGRWQTTLKTPAAGDTPYNVVVKAGSDTVKLDDVLIGEVWICSGQSNMQWKMRGFGPTYFGEAVAKANQPTIRYCEVPQALALEAQDDVQTRWSVCNPKTVLTYSAVAYFFANRLQKDLNVPIGLISTNWGGSPAEAWVREEIIASDFPEFDETRKQYPALMKEFGVVHARSAKMPKGIKHGLPSVLYNNMIHPLVPFAFRGVIWYQGESNVEKPAQYQKLFPALIESWREEWNQGDFPFYFVQIAPFKYGYTKVPAALLREAQLKTLSVPNTGMVVTMDIGDETNIHPKEKRPVGERLALIALARDYGRKGLVYSGPIYKGHQIVSDQIQIQFQHVGSGLASRDGKPLSHFTIAGKDNVFVPAEAVIQGDSIFVHSDQVQHPTNVRFAWGNADRPNLMNREGLPASSFRTDNLSTHLGNGIE